MAVAVKLTIGLTVQLNLADTHEIQIQNVEYII